MRFYGLGPGPPRLRVLSCRASSGRRSTVALGSAGGAGLSRPDTRRYIHRPRATSTPANTISPAIKAIRFALPVRKSWIVCQNISRNRLGRRIDGPKATRAGGQSQTKWPTVGEIHGFRTASTRAPPRALPVHLPSMGEIMLDRVGVAEVRLLGGDFPRAREAHRGPGLCGTSPWPCGDHVVYRRYCRGPCRQRPCLPCHHGSC